MCFSKWGGIGWSENTFSKYFSCTFPYFLLKEKNTKEAEKKGMISQENTIFLFQDSICFPKSENSTCFRSILHFTEFLTNTDNMFSLPCLAEQLKMSSSKYSDAKSNVRNHARNHLLLFSKKWWGLLVFSFFFPSFFFLKRGLKCANPTSVVRKGFQIIPLHFHPAECDLTDPVLEL